MMSMPRGVYAKDEVDENCEEHQCENGRPNLQLREQK